MSADGGGDEEAASGDMCCAGCGIAGIDEIKLTKCDACDLVRYCSVECQGDHEPKHKEECKKRAAELRDELLFKQPEGNHLGDCPICCVLLPNDVNKCALQLCCSKVICKGCFIANLLTERKQKLKPKCPFCREPLKKSQAKIYKNTMKRIAANDPVATFQFAIDCNKAGDHTKAFEYFTKAAALGDAEAHLRLAEMYHNGAGVEKNEKKEIYHLEEATIGGHPRARHNLGAHEGIKCNFERSIKHFVIAANQGHEGSMKALMGEGGFPRDFITKEELAATLRTHKAAVKAMNTPERVKTEASLGMLGLN
jgi:hypothetical protein